MTLNKLTMPAILVATVMVAGVFAFMPVQQASTVHTTITGAGGALGTPGNVDISTDLDDAQNQLAALIDFGSCTNGIGGGASCNMLTVVEDGIAYVNVTTTVNGATSGNGVGIEVDAAAICVDNQILIVDSPYTCAFPVLVGEVLSIADAADDDVAATAQVVVITNQDDPSV